MRGALILAISFLAGCASSPSAPVTDAGSA
jgi:hypothetical protein